jgi:predicted nucleic acid-binding protein
MLCVDASFALKLVLAETESEQVEGLWRSWIDDNLEIVAPYHLLFEVTSVIRNHVYRQILSVKAGEMAFTAIQAQQILFLHPQNLDLRAWQLAQQYNRPTAYDTYYLALAELQGCPLWTADKRLYRAVQNDLPWVHCVGA